MTPVPATPAHAPAMALIHAAAFPPAERWDADAMAQQLALPGVYGFLFTPQQDQKEVPAATREAVGAAATRLFEAPWLDHPPCCPSAFAESEGGFILARIAADEAEVLTLAVTPGARGRGLARLLLGSALARACTEGTASMFLEVSPDNAPAMALYAGAGFAPVGRRTRYYTGGGDALVLRCPVIPGAGAAGAPRPAAT